MREFNSKELLQVQELLGYIINSPIAYAKQKSVFNDEERCVWCEDWFDIEVLKYMINRDMYLRDLPPNRLKKTKFSRKKVVSIVENKIAEVDALDKSSNLLFIDKVGRGELLVYMSFFKNWDRIILNESNPNYVEFLNFVCKIKLNLVVEFYDKQDLTNFVIVKGFERDICPQEN
jgi:hypothetical protein